MPDKYSSLVEKSNKTSITQNINSTRNNRRTKNKFDELATGVLSNKRGKQVKYAENSMNVTQSQLLKSHTQINPPPHNNLDLNDSEDGTQTSHAMPPANNLYLGNNIGNEAISVIQEHPIPNVISPTISAEVHLANNPEQTGQIDIVPSGTMVEYKEGSSYFDNSERDSGFPMPEKYNR